MKPFQFKNFTVNQSSKVFRVGTDGVLLGASATVKDAQNILEIGTGTGLIALMIAQRNPDANITALDINEEAVAIASENFRNSPFSNRLKAVLQDFKIHKTDEKFDLIVSNPPFFEENPSEKERQDMSIKIVEKGQEAIRETSMSDEEEKEYLEVKRKMIANFYLNKYISEEVQAPTLEEIKTYRKK